ncbi:sulfate adenylyltransferase [bacterium]|nr:sulfate adenylyltransferase [candidate division CSSED10-310 bacterium]
MLVEPHGGRLIDRMVPEERRDEVMAHAATLRTVVLSSEKLKELQNIAHGVFSPLEGFFTSDEVASVIAHDTLPGGVYWTIPILLPVPPETAEEINAGDEIALAGPDGIAVAVMKINDKFGFDKQAAARAVFGTDDPAHPGVAALMEESDIYVGGPIDLFTIIDTGYNNQYLTPRQMRKLFEDRGWERVVAFQTRNPPHRAHEYLQKCALETCDGLFINPVIGRKKSGDFTDDLILEAYQVLIDKFYPGDRVVMSILPWEMRYAGPKEAIFHCIVRKNFGCSHHIIGRDHAGVGDYYDTFAAHHIFAHFPGLGIEPMLFDHSFYCLDCQNMGTVKTCPHGNDRHLNPAGRRIRAVITEGAAIDAEVMRPEIARILASSPDSFVK